jgi:acetyl-CoA C-acetyltransferase
VNPVAILGFARTPFGAQFGTLREVTPDKLGSAVFVAAVERSGVPHGSLARVVLGTLLDAGRGPNPARALIMEAGFGIDEGSGDGPTGVSLRAGGGSGLEALAFAAAELEGEQSAVAIGLDSSSLAPYLMPEARGGSKLGHGRLIDSALRDTWAHSDEELPLPALAAVAMQRHELERSHFLETRRISVERAKKAAGKGEIAPIGVPLAGGQEEKAIASDDLPGEKAPSPGDEAYAASLADGAAAVLAVPVDFARSLGKKDAPRLVAIARCSVESRRAPLAPAAALAALFKKTGKGPGDFSVIEVDESLFIAPEIARREHALTQEQLNPRGGAHAYGHAGGACGLRALVAALAELEARGGGRAAIAYGTGGGGAMALLVER